MKLEDVIKFLKDNAGDAAVKEYLQSLKAFDVNTVKSYLQSNEDGKRLLESLTNLKISAAVQAGVENFKKNNLDALVNEKAETLYNEKNAAETANAKELRLLKKKFNKSKKENEVAKLRKSLFTALVGC